MEILKENILTFSQNILGFDTIEIRVLDPESQQLTPLLHEGMQEEAASRLLYALEEDNGLTGYVAATGRSYLCPDTQAEERYLRGAEHARSSLTVPLRLHDVILGTFNVEGPGADTFDAADLEFLEHFGSVVAMALNQLQLMMAEKATTVEQHAVRMQQKVACPTDDILADTTFILVKYIGHDPDVSETLQRILTNVRQVRSSIGQVSEEESPAKTGVPPRQLPRKLRAELAQKRVLVVDSDDTMRAEAHKLLDPQGCVVEAVATGLAACRMMRSYTYDVVLADIRLSDMSGFDCFCKLRDIDAHTPVIFMTGFGYDASHSIVKARQMGLKAVLYKPFRVDQLLTEAGHITRLHVIIETNEGLEAAYDIAKCSERIDALFFGGVDMAAELRCPNTFESLIYARSRVVHASASAGLDVLDVPYLDLDDLQGMKKEAERVRDLGFTGKGSIHPKQIAAPVSYTHLTLPTNREV